jgi:hypothetical protein
VTRGAIPLMRALPLDCEIVLEVCPEDLRRQGYSADEVLSPWMEAGFYPYLIENGYDAAFYTNRARAAKVPRLQSLQPKSGPNLDLILSRTDADALSVWQPTCGRTVGSRRD